MKRIFACVSTVAALILFSACHSKKEIAAPIPEVSKAPPAEVPAPDTPATAGQNATEAISSARESLKANKFDEAAAKLAQLQLQGATFNTQQAKDYRQTLSEAYDRAVEAAGRGDPKGQAALQLLRAAGPK